MSDSDDHIDKVWDIAKDIRVAMFITWDGEKQRARPMATHPDRDEHAIYLLTDATSAKTWQIDEFPTVTLAYADKSGNDYLSISGEAVVSNDRTKIRDLFTPFAKAWWDSAEDPEIRVVKISPSDAELWDGPAGPVATVKMLLAAATNRRPDMGDNAKVRM